MTALNFPDSPAAGDIYDAPNGVQYQYDGVSWNVVSAAAGVPGPVGPQGEVGPVGFKYVGRINTEAELANLLGVTAIYEVWIADDTGIGYQCVANSNVPEGKSWTPLGRLVGENGAAGADGISTRYMGRINNYTELEALTPGAKGGQFYITNDTGEGYFALAIEDPNVVTAWEFMGRLVGQDGVDGPQGETGAAGPAGADGAQGEQGVPGLGLRFVMRVPTVGDLPATATQGDVYLIEETGDGHVWDETVPGFVNAGPIVGPTGAQGPAGAQGETGATGPAGEVGPAGPKGDRGDQGITGADGPKGEKGDVGPAGADGADGAVGPQGEQGIPGEAGPAGADGAVGPQGEQGIQGEAGPAGPRGEQGITGADGPAGPKGDQGFQGEVGPTGPVGPAGEKGDAGVAGPQGEPGPKGDQGDQGIPGLGIRFVGRVATVGDLPATATQGDLYLVEATGDAWVWSDTAAAFENAGPIVGPTGPQGEAGAAGATGPEGPQGEAGPTAVSADANNTSVLGTDGLLFTPAPDLTGYVPRTGADMTGQLNFKGDGVVAFQFDNGFNFFGLLTSSALRVGTKSLLGFTENDVVAAVPFRLTSAPTTDEHAANKKYVDDKVAAGSGVSGLPTTGGTMTGTIAAPIATPMSFINSYSLFSANGGVSVRFGATDLIAFSSTGIINYKGMTTPGTGIGVQFGSGGGYLAKGGSNGIGAYIGGQLRWTFGPTEHMSTLPIAVSAEATAANHLVQKSYVDTKPTIISMASGGTPPSAASYPENTLLVEYA